MNTKQLVQQIKLTAAIEETGHPWEYRSPHSGVEWQKEHEPDKGVLWRLYHQFEIRLALAMPGDGRELHNPDNLTAEQVGAGWRLCLKADLEIVKLYGQYHGWDILKKEWEAGCEGTLSDTTYRLPLSTPWPEAKVDEYAELKKAFADGKTIQHNSLSVSSDPVWKDCENPTWHSPVFRYRIKSEPVMVPLVALDVPPRSVFRFKEAQANWVTPLCICHGAVGFADAKIGGVMKIGFYDLMEIAEINRSIAIDGRWSDHAWEPCSKPVL